MEEIEEIITTVEEEENIPKIDTENIKNASAYGLPDRPSERGMSAEDIKKAFYAPIVGTNISLTTEINNLIDNINLRNASIIGKICEVVKNINIKIPTLLEYMWAGNMSVRTFLDRLSGGEGANYIQMSDPMDPLETPRALNEIISDINKYKARSAKFSIDEEYKLTLTLYADENGEKSLNETEIDLPLEAMVVNASVNEEGTKLILILQNEKELEIDLANLLKGIATQDFVNKQAEQLRADFDSGIEAIKSEILGVEETLELINEGGLE